MTKARLQSKLWVAGMDGGARVTLTRSTESVAEGHGDSPPMLFHLPGSVGYNPSLAAFVRSLDIGGKVIPVRYPDLKAILTGEDSVAAMAMAAFDQIEQKQPTGDIRILGQSLGGLVAFETAARLIEAGRTVQFLGIVDASLLGEKSTRWRTVTRTFDRLRNNRVTTSRMMCRALAKFSVAAHCEHSLAEIMERKSNGQFNLKWFRIKVELQDILRTRAYFKWVKEDRPGLPIGATLFRCERLGMPLYLGWDRLLQNVDVIPITGSHYDWYMDPHVAANRPLVERAVVRSCSISEPRHQERQVPVISLRTPLTSRA